MDTVVSDAVILRLQCLVVDQDIRHSRDRLLAPSRTAKIYI